MGIFNTLFVDTACPVCASTVPLQVQFQYGAARHLEYRIGEMLHWGGSQYGRPSYGNVVVQGIAGPCPNCRTPYLEYDIFIKSGRITEILPHDNKYDYAGRRDEGYFVVVDGS